MPTTAYVRLMESATKLGRAAVDGPAGVQPRIRVSRRRGIALSVLGSLPRQTRAAIKARPIVQQAIKKRQPTASPPTICVLERAAEEEASPAGVKAWKTTPSSATVDCATRSSVTWAWWLASIPMLTSTREKTMMKSCMALTDAIDALVPHTGWEFINSILSCCRAGGARRGSCSDRHLSRNNRLYLRRHQRLGEIAHYLTHSDLYSALEARFPGRF